MTANAQFNHSQRDLILALLQHIGNDGHTIWKEEVLKDFPVALRQRFTRVYRSDGTPKGSITDREGHAVGEMRGVYGLTVLMCLCSDLDIAYESKMGRGFQARVCTAAVQESLK